MDVCSHGGVAGRWMCYEGMKEDTRSIPEFTCQMEIFDIAIGYVYCEMLQSCPFYTTSWSATYLSLMSFGKVCSANLIPLFIVSYYPGALAMTSAPLFKAWYSISL